MIVKNVDVLNKCQEMCTNMIAVLTQHNRLVIKSMIIKSC